MKILPNSAKDQNIRKVRRRVVNRLSWRPIPDTETSAYRIVSVPRLSILTTGTAATG